MHWGCRRLLEDKRGQEAQAAAERRHQRRLRQDAYTWRWKRPRSKPALACAGLPSSPAIGGVDDASALAQTVGTHPWMNGCRMVLASMLLAVVFLDPSFSHTPLSISNMAHCRFPPQFDHAVWSSSLPSSRENTQAPTDGCYERAQAVPLKPFVQATVSKSETKRQKRARHFCRT